MSFELKDFMISQDTLKKIDNERELQQWIDEGVPMQKILGFSNEVTAELYEMAKNILEQNRFDDATDAFTFLVSLNPYISDFWLGLGMSQQRRRDYDNALNSYSVAYKIEEEKIFPYLVAAQCCMEINEYDQAVEIIELAVTYANDHLDQEEGKQLKKDAAVAKEYVLSQKQKKT